MSFISRAILGCFALILTVAVMAGLFHSPQSVHAACGEANEACGGQDVTKTSAMLVNHVTVAGLATPTFNVEPDNSEDWQITAFWEDAMCGVVTEVATVTVTWNGSAWVISNLVTTQDIVDVDVCLDSSCTSGPTTHSWKYKLTVDVNDPDDMGNDLKEVEYETVAVDDGDTLSLCVETGAVSPLSQTNTGFDDPGGTGDWFSTDCTYACSAVGGSMTIGYN